MALTSSSTITDVLAQYNDNLSWTGNPTKAAAALEAIRWLIVNRGRSVYDGASRIDFQSLLDERDTLEAYVNTASSTRRSPFTRAKMLR